MWTGHLAGTSTEISNAVTKLCPEETKGKPQGREVTHEKNGQEFKMEWLWQSRVGLVAATLRKSISFFFFVVCETKPRTSHMPGKTPVPEPHPCPRRAPSICETVMLEEWNQGRNKAVLCSPPPPQCFFTWGLRVTLRVSEGAVTQTQGLIQPLLHLYLRSAWSHLCYSLDLKSPLETQTNKTTVVTEGKKCFSLSAQAVL